jgi:hypothetical protein
MDAILEQVESAVIEQYRKGKQAEREQADS